MPMFENAQDFTINGGTFIDQGNTTDPMKPLIDRVVRAAIHDSDERYDPPRCHPETRKAILDRIDLWATNPTERPVLWLNGPAGAGKSAVAQTLAERWARRRILGASFFMQRTAAGRNNREHLMPTLAYQLTVHDSRARAHVKSVMISDPQILDRSLETQLERLIADTLLPPGLDSSRDSGVSQIIIIDGLDECCVPYRSQTYEEQQKRILDAIASVCRIKPSLRFLIASRPECQIRDSFSRSPLHGLTTQITLWGGSNSRADIELFLECKFAEIRRTHPLLDPSWPPRAVINRLVDISSGHFVYPATIVRHLESPRINPEEALNGILGHFDQRFYGRASESSLYSDGTQHDALTGLDDLYLHILQAAVHNVQSNAFFILQILISNVLDYGQDSGSCGRIARILDVETSQIYIDLVDLHSLLDIPRDPSHNITFHHASFGEFLADPRRSGAFWAGGPPPVGLQIKIIDVLPLQKRVIPFRWYKLRLAMSTTAQMLWCGLDTFPELIRLHLGKPATVIYALKFFLQVIWMANPNEIISFPWKWIWLISARNVMIIGTHFYWYFETDPLGVPKSKSGKGKGLGRPYLALLTSRQVFVVIVTHLSAIVLWNMLSLKSFVLETIPNTLYMPNLLIMVLSSFVTIVKYTYLLNLLTVLIFSYFDAIAPLSPLSALD